jgi:hypothetical protein
LVVRLTDTYREDLGALIDALMADARRYCA